MVDNHLNNKLNSTNLKGGKNVNTKSSSLTFKKFQPETTSGFSSIPVKGVNSISKINEDDNGKKGPVQAAQVKLALPKMATKIALDAIQLHGGYGYSREFPVERFLRDNKLNEIGAGTNEVMIMIIAKNLLSELKSKAK